MTLKPYLVLDLDNTLVYTTTYNFKEADSKVFNYNGIERHVVKRPYLDWFMDYCKKNFNVIIYTAGSRWYAEKIVRDYFDLPENNVYYRENLCRGLKRRKCLNIPSYAPVYFIDDNVCHIKAFECDQSLLIKGFFGSDPKSELLSAKAWLDTFIN